MLARYGVMAASLALMVGCVGTTAPDVPAAKQTTGRLPTVAEVPDAEETVRGADDPSVVTLNLGKRLRERKLAHGDELPNGISVPATNLNGVPLTTALQAVLAGTDISLSWDSGAFADRLVSVSNLSGRLPQVVEKICGSAKVFCNYRHGLLELKDKETFVVDLPAVLAKAGSGGASGAANSMADAIGELAGEKVNIDRQGGNIIYTTDVEGQEHVHEYLERLRSSRPLVVVQLYLWEVTLNKENGEGINWNNFQLDKFGGKVENVLLNSAGTATGFGSLASPGVSLGATFSGKVDAQSVMQFLASQGQVQTISNPQLTFVSGSDAEFKVGGKQRYISQVGQLTTSNNVSGTNSSSNSANGVGNNTISTDSIDTGLQVTISGAYEGGVISASLEIALQDVVGLNPTTSQGVTIDLPETSERKVTTSLRVRPGDNLVLAGLVTSKDTNNRNGIPLPFGGNISMFSDDQFMNNELVVMVKPSVVVFTDSGDVEDDQKKSAATNMAISIDPNMVIIDNSGARTLKPSSGSPRLPTQLKPAASVVMPLTSATVSAQPQGPDTPDAVHGAAVPNSGASDQGDKGVSVNNGLLQSGFGSAFDSLQAATEHHGDEP